MAIDASMRRAHYRGVVLCVIARRFACGSRSSAWPAAVFALALALGTANVQAQVLPRLTEPAGAVDIASAPRTADIARVPHLIVRYTNALRTAHGAQPTVVNEELSRAAGYFADFMARTDRHSHEADGNTPSARAKQYGYNFCMVSENIAMQFHSLGFATEELAERFVVGWENSPGHRKNMLDPDAMETGTAVARSARTGRYYAVQMFGRPRSAMYAFEIANESATAVRYQLGSRGYELPPRRIRTHEECRATRLVMQNLGDGQASIMPAQGDRFAVVRDQQGLRLVRQ